MRAAPADATAFRKPTNVSLDRQLVDEAKRLGINLSRACEEGLAARIRELKAQRWLDENREALLSSNAYVEKHGLPLARFRMF